MNLGIITFHRALNYGAILQAYALQQFLLKLDIKNNIIDYRCPYIEHFYKPIKANIIRQPKSFIKEWLYCVPNTLKRKKFDKFTKKYLFMTEKISHYTDLIGLNNIFDCFVTGSDQVWNSRWSGFDGAYFLDFAHSNKKNSYAASFGASSIDEKLIEKYKKYLLAFNFLSVREADGVDIIKGLIDKEAVVSIDPTCLLSIEDWKKVAKPPKEKGYVLLYLLEQSLYLENFAKELAEKNNIKVITITDGLKKKKGLKQYGFLGPDEFLGLFCNAEYIVTNSFHGLMFSVIFKKQFYLAYQQYAGAPNSRLKNFIKEYHLERRVLSINQPIFKEDIDYDKIDLMIQEAKEKSKNYFYKLRESYEQ